MKEEEARRIAVEENYEYKQPRDKEEKRFLRIIAHFDELLFKESLLGEPVREGEKSASMPLKFKLQGEGIFVALFFHMFSLAVYLLFLVIAFWVKYSPDSTTIETAFFSSPAYKVLTTLMAAAILSAVPVLFIKRYVIYPEGFLFVRVKNFLIGYWLALSMILLFNLIKIAVVKLKGEGLASVVLPSVYSFIETHPKEFLFTLVGLAVALTLAGLLLLFMTRKDYLNAVGILLLTFGITLAVLVMLLNKYGYTPQNAEWLIYYLTAFLMEAFSEEGELIAVLIALSTYFLFKRKISELERKMYKMPWS